MKARIQPKETVYLYHIEEHTARGEEVYAVLNSFGVGIKEIPDSLLSQTLGFCVGMQGFTWKEAPEPQKPFQEEVLVMQGFTRQRMDALMRAFMKRKVTPVALKAVVTEHNCKWACQEFFEELLREHRFMAAYMGLRKLIQRAEALTCDKPEFQSALGFAKEQVARGNDASLDTLRQALDGLNAQVAAIETE